MKSGNEARTLATRVVMMPRDTHEQGYITGGVLLKNIDLAGAVIARRACANKIIKRMVTRAMDNIEFTQPVLVSDVLTCYGYVLRIGTTSITVQIEVEVDRFGETIPVTQAQLTFVALDASGRPTAVIKAAEAAGPTSQPATSPAKDSDAIEAATPVSKPEGTDKGKGKGKKRQVKKATAEPSSARSRAQAQRGKVRSERGTKRAEHSRKKSHPRLLAVRVTMMPADTNGMGNIFGGVLLDMMDHAGAYVAKRACASQFIQRCATRAMGKVEFKQPVHVNDVLSVYGTVTKIGATSVSVHVEAEVERQGAVIPVTQADLVFVAVDQKGVKTPVVCGAAKKRQRSHRRGSARSCATGGDGCC